MITQNLTLEKEKIKSTSPFCIAEILGVSMGLARKFKQGKKGLSNRQALYLKEHLGLSPDAFNEIYIASQVKRDSSYSYLV